MSSAAAAAAAKKKKDFDFQFKILVVGDSCTFSVPCQSWKVN